MNRFDPYDAYRYDENFVLRVPLTLSIIMFWSAHHLLMLVGSGLSNSGEVFGSVVNHVNSWPFLISDIPGLLVLFARLNRVPEAGRFVRSIWRHGIAFLVAGIALSSLAAIHRYGRELLDFEQIGCWVIVINIVTTIYLLTAPRVKDVFSDFPAPEKSDHPSQGTS